MSGFETVIYERHDAVGLITLNRPHVRNAYSIQMRDDLYEVLRAVKEDEEVRAVILRGAGDRAFCAGADLKEFLTAPSAVKARRIRAVRDLWRLFLSVPQPLIAALHGYVYGSGMEIALVCDLRIASEDVEFGLPEVSLGIIPGAGGTQTLPRVMGLARSLDMLLTGRRLGAEEALASGLVNRVYPREELLPRAEALARRIAALPPLAVRKAKEAVWRGADLPLSEGLELEKNLACQLTALRNRPAAREE